MTDVVDRGATPKPREGIPRPVPRLSRLAVDRALSSHDQIAAILGTEILRGIHHPGDNMPAEPDLIARFQVSRTVMREVMKTLAAKGLVVSKTRIGTRVRDPVHWNFFDADVLSYGRVLQSAKNGFAISIEAGCNGVEAAIVLIAAMIAFAAPWKHRLAGIATGLVTVQVMNLLRIVSLFYLGQWSMAIFQFAHLYLWQALIMLDVLIVWLLWLRWLPSQEAPAPVAAAAA